MPMTRCPHCAMPLSKREREGESCPVCQKPFAEDGAAGDLAVDRQEPAVQTAGPASPGSPSPRGLTAWVVGAVGLLLAAGATVCLLTASPTPVDPPRKRGPRRVASLPAKTLHQAPMAASLPATLPAGPGSQPVLTAARTKQPSGLQPAEAPQRAGGAAQPQPSTTPVKPPAPPQPAAPLEEPKFAVIVPLEDGEHEESITLDTPGQVRVVPGLNGLKKLNLRGQALRVEIQSLNGEASLEVGKLQAREILLVEGMNGQSRLRIDQPGSTVRVGQGLHGEARAEILAAGGAVRFTDTSCIDGGCKVRIVARHVELGRLAIGARVEVTLTAGGSLSFAEVNDGARLAWRKERPDDPAPAIRPGKVGPGARFEQQ